MLEIGKFLKVYTILYYFWLLLVLIFSTNKKLKNNKKLINFFMLLMLIYFYFSILGFDYFSYYNIFYIVKASDKYELLKNDMEPIFYYIIYFFRKYNFLHNIFFLFIKGVPLLINYYLIRKESNKKMLALYFLFSSNFFASYCDALRQNIASSFLLLGIYLSLKKEILNKFLGKFCYIIAFFNHYSSLFLFFILLIKNKLRKIHFKQYIGLILINIFVSYLFYLILISLKVENYNNTILKKIMYYLLDEKIMRSEKKLIEQIFYKLLVFGRISIAIFINMILLKNKKLFKEFKEVILYIGTSCTLVSSLFIFLNVIFTTRFNLNFCYGFYLLIPDLNKEEKYLCLALYLLNDILYLAYYLVV